jgi:hypothetical protein
MLAFPPSPALNRWIGLTTICVGAVTIVAFQLWQTNACYEEYESCGSIYPLFDTGWIISAGLVIWVTVASVARAMRRLRMGRQ